MARIMASYQIPKTKYIDLKPLNRGGGRFPLKKHPAVQPEAYTVSFLKSLPQSDMELFTQGPGKYQGKGNTQNFGSSYTLALILHWSPEIANTIIVPESQSLWMSEVGGSLGPHSSYIGAGCLVGLQTHPVFIISVPESMVGIHTHTHRLGN